MPQIGNGSLNAFIALLCAVGFVLVNKELACSQTHYGDPEKTVMPGVYRLLGQGKEKAALAMLRQAEQRGQKSWSIYHYIGAIESNYENHAEALKYFDMCCQIRPHGSRTRAFKAREELKLGQGQKCVDDCTLALSLAKDGPAPAKALGADENEYTDSEFALYLRCLGYTMLKEFDLALADLNTLLDSKRPPTAAFLVNRGLIYSRLNQYEKALDDENKAVAAGLKVNLVFLNRAATYFYLKQYDKSAQDYSRVIATNPKDDENYMYRSFPYYMAGKYQEALNDVNKAQQLSDYPDAGVYELAKSEIYKAWGKADLAKQCKVKAKKLGTDVSDPDPWGEKAIMREHNAGLAECNRLAALRAAKKN